jgi:MFS family permease
MTLAQVSDVIFLFLLPLMLKGLGYKKTILLGIFAWAARYFLLASGVHSASFQTSFIFAAILLHGVCYDFLFIAGQLYADNEANERIRGATQGFMAFILWGIGAFVGTMLAGKVLAMHTYTIPQGPIAHDWLAIWLTPACGATVVLVIFALLFREPSRTKLPSDSTPQSTPAESACKKTSISKNSARFWSAACDCRFHFCRTSSNFIAAADRKRLFSLSDRCS